MRKTKTVHIKDHIRGGTALCRINFATSFSSTETHALDSITQAARQTADNWYAENGWELCKTCFKQKDLLLLMGTDL